MRQIQLLVAEDDRDAVVEVLGEEGVDYVRQRAWVGEEEGWLVTFPVPTDAIGHFLARLEEVGVDVDRYTVVTSVESAMTPGTESLLERFASDFDPLSTPELRSKARDMSRDPRSFLALIALSAVIAAAGLLTGSPAVVVGSMVIAPIVGPVLTAAVGAATGDRGMLVDSVWLQAAGLGLAVAGAWAFGLVVEVTGFLPGTLDVTTIDLIAVRISPGALTVAIGLASGAAAAFGLATKGPTSVIGVMIAAALIPAAATAGVAGVWNQPRVAVGSLLLLFLTVVLINVAAYAVLVGLGYRPEGREWHPASESSVRRATVVASAAVLVVAVVAIGVGSARQMAFERTVNQEVEATLSESEYGSLEPVAVRVQYAGVRPFAAPATVTVTASRTAGAGTPAVADELDRRIREVTGRDVAVRVTFVDYQRSEGAGPDEAGSLARPSPPSLVESWPGNRFSRSRPNHLP